MIEIYELFKFLFILVFIYFLGSLPFSYIITKLCTGKDIREIGSKNPGATNVFRNVGKIPAILTLFLDVLKGYFTIIMANFFYKNNLIITIIFGFIVIFAHSFSIFLNFKGGKSVAASLGVFLGLAPLAIFIDFIIFLVFLGLFGFVSIGSIVASIFLPLIIYYLQYNKIIFITSIFISIFVIFRHKENIKRLFKKTENKIF